MPEALNLIPAWSLFMRERSTTVHVSVSWWEEICSDISCYLTKQRSSRRRGENDLRVTSAWDKDTLYHSLWLSQSGHYITLLESCWVFLFMEIKSNEGQCPQVFYGFLHQLLQMYFTYWVSSKPRNICLLFALEVFSDLLLHFT